jgi:hypothetical protein
MLRLELRGQLNIKHHLPTTCSHATKPSFRGGPGVRYFSFVSLYLKDISGDPVLEPFFFVSPSLDDISMGRRYFHKIVGRESNSKDPNTILKTKLLS